MCSRVASIVVLSFTLCSASCTGTLRPEHGRQGAPDGAGGASVGDGATPARDAAQAPRRDSRSDSAGAADAAAAPSSTYGTLRLLYNGSKTLSDDTVDAVSSLDVQLASSRTPLGTVSYYIDKPAGATGAADGTGVRFSPTWPGGTGVHSVEIVVKYADGHAVRRRFIISHTLASSLRPQARLPDSVWAKPIAAGAAAHADSAANIAEVLKSGGGKLTSDPTQYTYPVYVIAPVPAGRTVADRVLTYSGFYRNYVPELGPKPERSGEPNGPGGYSSPLTRRIDVAGIGGPPAGNEGQVIFWDKVKREYWAFWRYQRGSGSGHAHFVNGYHYGTGPGYSGTLDGRAGRGAGTSKLVGLVLRDELDFGHVPHALDFAYNTPSSKFVSPASKSDGNGGPNDAPQGARLQLDPALDVTQIPGLSREGKILARALQRYGMFVIDSAGSSKIFVEASETARYGQAGLGGQVSTVKASTVSPIPVRSLRRVR